MLTVPGKPKDSRIAKCGCFLCHFHGRSLLPRSEVTRTLLQLFTSREGQPWTIIAPFSPALVRRIQGQRWWRNTGILFKVKAWSAAPFVTLDGSRTLKADLCKEGRGGRSSRKTWFSSCPVHCLSGVCCSLALGAFWYLIADLEMPSPKQTYTHKSLKLPAKLNISEYFLTQQNR